MHLSITLQHLKVLTSTLLLTVMLGIVCIPQLQASLVWTEFEPRVSMYSDRASNITYLTTYGQYIVSKDTGAIQYVYSNGSILSPSTKFVLQYLKSQDSWEDFEFAQPVFTDVQNELCQWRQTVLNGSQTLGYVVTNCLFSEESPPKLSIVWDYGGIEELTFRFTFKVTLPQAWEYFVNGEDFVNIPQSSALSLVRKKVRVVESPESSVLQLLVDWSDYGDAIVMLKGSTVTVVFGRNLNQIDPTVVGQSSRVYATAHSFQRRLQYMAGRWHVFYATGGYMVTQNSVTGLTGNWTDSSTIREADDGFRFSTTFNGTHFYYAYASGSPAQTLKYRRATPETNGTLTWSATEQSASANGQFNNPSIAVDSTGYPFIAYKNITGVYNPFITKSAWNNGSWSTASGYPLQLSSTTDFDWYALVVPLSSGRIYALYARDGQKILGKLYNGSAWGSEETVSSLNIWVGEGLCADTEGDDIHLVFTRKTSYYIYYLKRTFGTGWSTETVIYGSSSYPATISVDGSKVYVYWQTSSVLRFKVYIGGSWSQILSWVTDTFYPVFSLNSVANITNSKNGIIWTDSDRYIMFEKMNFSDSAGSFTVWSTNNDYPVESASWDDLNKKLSFWGFGDLTVDAGSYGQPFSIWDGTNFLSWSLSGSNITFTATDTNIEITWVWTPDIETRGEGEEELEEEEVTDEVEPTGVDWAQWGLYGLIGGMVVVTMGGIASALSKRKVSRKATGKVVRVKTQPSGKGTNKAIKVKGSQAYGGRKPKGVGRKKQKWD